jgi:hypothetical protein
MANFWDTMTTDYIAPENTVDQKIKEHENKIEELKMHEERRIHDAFIIHMWLAVLGVILSVAVTYVDGNMIHFVCAIPPLPSIIQVALDKLLHL